MDINLISINDFNIAEIVSNIIEINNAQDALDILANCAYQDARRIVMYQENITDSFFDLKTTLAGDVLQKFSNYNVKLAIVGDFSKYSSQSLRDFIYESNKAGRISFVSTRDEAIDALSKGIRV
ncbi:protein of unknown function [Mucilaginibacter lappiensis]|uniref:DUF4180 domain-containing protein n=1 Tax=Mucilaginibacter lappiensis TaxID=354630 RepID=A0ABR6PRS7_9SPHI|nr:DUF4180 domain-containing protein [Mucilaginibacter lappiensis]MBB6112478.1 hypothetical protein [Mucilaginibacter lappiensis]SIS02182.1 protein of unknown function [Mucilaginibacter lappiensis]